MKRNIFFLILLTLLISNALAQERPAEEPSAWRFIFIDGWVWWYALIISGLMASGFFIYFHTKRVKKIVYSYPKKVKGVAEFLNLQFKPGFLAILFAFIFMGIIYLVAWWIAFEGDFKVFENEAAKPWGRPYTFMWRSLVTSFIFIFICYLLGRLFKKRVPY